MIRLPIIFITFARRYSFAHAELMLFFLFKREMVETRTWEGRGIYIILKCVYYALSS